MPLTPLQPAHPEAVEALATAVPGRGTPLPGGAG
jgi:hypothetical protein